MKNKFKKTKELLLNILFPPLCLSCAKNINHKREIWLCSTCLNKIKKYQKPKRIKNNIIFTTAPYEGVVKNIIHTFKYRKIKTAIKTIQKELIHPYVKENRSYFDKKHWIITPVPIHSRKETERGFNQSNLIAQALRHELKINNISSEIEKPLIKQKRTKPQAKLSLKERKKNLKDSFSFKKEVSIKNKNIILVDDVYTTGSTVKECLKIIKKYSPNKIYVFTIAKT